MVSDHSSLTHTLGLNFWWKSFYFVDSLLVFFSCGLEIKTSALHTPVKCYAIGRVFESYVRQEVEK